MKTILILGATSSIASATARLWATEKAQFFLVARDNEKLASIADDLRARGALRVEHHTADLENALALAGAVDAAYAVFASFDIALVAQGNLPDQAACEHNIESLQHAFSLNAVSVMSALTLIAQPMAKAGSGVLAVISSVAGDRGRPSNYVYGAAKAAVSTFAEGLRTQLFKHNVHVLTIKPGFVATPMTQHLELPALLLATPDRVARDIVRAVQRKTNTLYTPWFWRFILLIIRHIPEVLFKKLSL